LTKHTQYLLFLLPKKRRNRRVKKMARKGKKEMRRGTTKKAKVKKMINQNIRDQRNLKRKKRKRGRAVGSVLIFSIIAYRFSAPSDSGETHVTFISSSDAKPKVCCDFYPPQFFENKEKELEIKCRNLEQQLSVEKKKVKQLEAEVAELKKSTSGKSHTNSSLLPGKAKKKGKSK
jgi:hypothetical protein